MSETITLYVDGACRGNPGSGGWGAYILMKEQQHKLYGGEKDTTNNRMELTAAIEGIAFCPLENKLIVWTDSTYVQKGMTEWITGWKKKNWKGVKNPDLWQKLDATCQNRDIEWNWVKGHAGHEGNEMADQLANNGVDELIKTQVSPTKTIIISEPNPMNKKKVESTDWLLDDPFGFDLMDISTDEEPESNEEIQPNKETETETETETEVKPTTASLSHPHIVITPATVEAHGPRQLILDTETTGFYFQDTDRIIEVGAIEMINRKLTGSSIHIYINPEKAVGESENIHGISDDFLKDKPKYAQIADVLYDYLKGAEIIAHNATFDMNFLNMEFKRVGLGTLSDVCSVTDTLAMAKNKHPGQKNSLDALVRRYEIPQRDRTFHGALLDAEILADVYLAMTGGQVSFDMDSEHHAQQGQSGHRLVNTTLPIIEASAEEQQAHDDWIQQYQEKNSAPCLFIQTN